MSLDLAREVNREHPHLLRENTGATCHAFTLKLMVKLKAHGHAVFLMCKSPGEGQYVPPGFRARTVTGLDGKQYVCSGVSHDAIWCDGKQFDTIASANEHDIPIYRKNTEPFWSHDPLDGPQITGTPVWTEIHQNHWRPNNPPLKDASVPVPPTEPPSPPTRFPSYEDLGGDAFGRAMIGVPLQADYHAAGQQLNDGSTVWSWRTCYSLMAALVQSNGQPIDAASIVRGHRNEWRRILGLPPV